MKYNLKEMKKEYNKYAKLLEEIDYDKKEDREIYETAKGTLDNLKEAINYIEGAYKVDNRIPLNKFIKDAVIKQRNKTLRQGDNLIGFSQVVADVPGLEVDLDQFINNIPVKARKGKVTLGGHFIAPAVTEGTSDAINITDDNTIDNIYNVAFNINMAGFISNFSSDKLMDDPNVQPVVDYVVASRIRNYNNKRLVEAIVDAVGTPTTYANLNEFISNGVDVLTGASRLNAVIITNNDGFKKLNGLDSFGNRLLKKVDGNFIFDDKYPVYEMIDDVLATDTTNGIPMIVADLRSTVSKVTYKDPQILVREMFTGTYNDLTKVRVIFSDTYIPTAHKTATVGYYKEA